MQMTTLQNMSPEMRAHIYQQLSDLEPHLPEGSGITVYIDDADIKNISAAIRVNTPYGEIQAEGQSTDVYHSLSIAKESVIKQLGEMERATMDSDSSHAEAITEVKNKTSVH